MGNVGSSGEEDEETNTIDPLGLPESLKSTTNQINFHDACVTNNLSYKFFKETVCELYPEEAKTLLSQQDSLLCLPFHHAIIGGDFEIVKFLLEKSVQFGVGETLESLINRPIANNASSVHLAVTSGNFELLKYLVDNGANKNIQTTMGATPLHVASVCGSDRSEAGSIEMVKLLLTEENINYKTTANETALYLALNHYSTEEASVRLTEEIANFLITQPGIDLSPKSLGLDAQQNTMIALASMKGYVTVFQALLELQQDDWADSDFEAQGGFHCIHLAAKCGSIGLIDLLLSRGIDVDLLAKRKETPLFFAIFGNHFELVKYLVEKGANVNYQCNNTPILSYACGQGRTEIANYLLDHGADPSIRDRHNNAPLHLAVCEGNFHEITESLLKKLNNVNEKNGKGKTPLYLACDRPSNEKTVELLLKYGADVNDISPKGATALHVAAHRGSVSIIKILLQYNADCSMYTNDGKLPIQFALELGSKDSVALLLEKAKESEVSYLNSMVSMYQQKKKINPQIINLIIERIEQLSNLK